VAVATFEERSDSLQVTSELLVEQYQLQSNYQRIPDLLMNKPICYTDAEKLDLQPYLLFGQPDDGELQSWLAHHDNLAGSRSIRVLGPFVPLSAWKPNIKRGTTKAFSRSAKHCN